MADDGPRAGSAGSRRRARTGSHGQGVAFLLSQLGSETASRFRSLMREVDLEPRHYALLGRIAQVQGRAQNEIGESLRIPPSSLVAVIDHLEERGLVERRPHPADRRARLLYLTGQGEDALARAARLTTRFEGMVCKGLTDEERSALVGTLRRVAGNLGL